ncbi:antibiotic biosynthesis monooxygenase [Algoriphagus aestuariicola]|uniref:Antibiotic biosynthesis monooxygenase n=1 Tax=Algoriphagus aestuariicola TaxID=1852016 RepID=A0ABS3BJD7_9BACT|nr:putative quinol monooxygenase [Algoriphagus aestuariicola]MBN7799376.1 antibiotic biosynthesis monooxygenase [Algoriphagus aestuariicola]
MRSFFPTVFLFLVATLFSFQTQGQTAATMDLEKLKIRIAEIEIHPEHLDAYLEILKVEAEASIRLEPGVLAIFPMSEKESPTTLRLIEIYQNEDAYQAHLQTPNFQQYKTSTLHMVKSLKLVEMDAIDPESMSKIFKKLSLN